MARDALALPLLDFLAQRVGCDYLSDLCFFHPAERRALAREIEGLSVERADLREWNDALEYFTGARPRANAEEARSALIAGLSAP